MVGPSSNKDNDCNDTDDKPASASTRSLSWVKMGLLLVAFIVVSVALVFPLQYLVDKADLPLDQFALLSYLIVFGIQLLSNLTLVPAGPPFATSIMIVAATHWNPLFVALAASIGGTIGELSGYFVGYYGGKSSMVESTRFFGVVHRWMSKFGSWAIAILAFQPLIPFDIGGIIAGTSRMPLRKFIPALWIGKYPKYILICYAGVGLIDVLPFFK